MPRSTWLQQALALSVFVAPAAIAALPACGFGGGEGEAEDKCDFEFRELCELTFKGSRTFSNETLATAGEGCTKVIPATTGMPELCVISAENLDIPAGVTLSATGTRPLVLAASGNIRIFGTLSVSSKAGATETLGAGAETFRCETNLTAPGASTMGGGGGAGASFRGAGGNGAKGGVGTGNPTTGGEAIATVDSSQLTTLHGGCRGQAGGNSASASSGGRGGAAGGVVYLAAKGAVQILAGGAVVANGAGGSGGAILSGGGGGGSGGMIIIEAPQVIHSGTLSANGGGGGEGGSDTTAGAPGEDGAAGSTNAKGGDTPDPLGNGGAGGARDFAAAGAGAEAAGGGGGGGGGVGFIRIVSPKINGQGGLASPKFD